jgi:hypothetical protein
MAELPMTVLNSLFSKIIMTIWSKAGISPSGVGEGRGVGVVEVVDVMVGEGLDVGVIFDWCEVKGAVPGVQAWKTAPNARAGKIIIQKQVWILFI